MYGRFEHERIKDLVFAYFGESPMNDQDAADLSEWAGLHPGNQAFLDYIMTDQFLAECVAEMPDESDVMQLTNRILAKIGSCGVE